MADKIKVLRIQHNFVEPTNHQLLEELGKFPELEIHALCPEWGIESGNMRVIKEPPRGDLTIGKTVLTKHYATTTYLNQLASMIRRLKPDILNVHDEPYCLTMGQALIYRSILSPGSRLVFCSAQNIYKDLPPPFAQIERWTYRAAVAGYGCCEGVKEVARKKGFDGIFDVLPLGMDPELFTYRQRDGKIFDRPFVVGYVGQVVEEKGVFDLLRAFTSLESNAVLRMLGGGPHAGKLKQAAHEAGVADHVELPGPVSHADVPKTMDTFDVLVIPSHTTPTWKEQFGRVICEANSMGVPVIGSDSGSIPEVVGDAGLIFKEKDHEHLARLLQDLVDHPDRLPEMSAKARARAVEHFSWKRVAEMTRDIYHRMMETG